MTQVSFQDWNVKSFFFNSKNYFVEITVVLKVFKYASEHIDFRWLQAERNWRNMCLFVFCLLFTKWDSQFNLKNINYWKIIIYSFRWAVVTKPMFIHLKNTYFVPFNISYIPAIVLNI